MASGTSHEEKLGAVREYLERHCVGWECRRLSAWIIRGLARDGFPMAPETLQGITKELLRSGVFVCSDDTRVTGGYYIAASRREAMEYWRQLERRTRGTIDTQNVVMKLMDEKFPQRELVFGTAARPT